MSDELKENEQNEKKECKCICQNEGFRKFLVVALGTFVGVYCALALFAAIHKPPMLPPCPCQMRGGYPCQMMLPPKHFDRGQRADFQAPDRGQIPPAPFEAQRPQPRK